MGLPALAPVLRGADVTPTSDRSRAVLAVTPRTGLPPEADDPNRPRNLRLLKPGVWIDDAGVDDNGNIYNQYRRSSFGTWSNYDEAIANPFPLTDPLVAKNGQPVKDAASWWSQRRPEILSDFYTEIYGRMPESLPKVTWEVTAVNESGAVRTKTIVGHIDNSAYPEVTPAGAPQFLSDRLPGDMGGTPMPRGTGVPPVGLSGLSKIEMRVRLVPAVSVWR
jgi:hypothetical protein